MTYCYGHRCTTVAFSSLRIAMEIPVKPLLFLCIAMATTVKHILFLVYLHKWTTPSNHCFCLFTSMELSTKPMLFNNIYGTHSKFVLSYFDGKRHCTIVVVFTPTADHVKLLLFDLHLWKTHEHTTCFLSCIHGTHIKTNAL